MRRIGPAPMRRGFTHRFQQARALQSFPAPDDPPSPVDEAHAAAPAGAPNGLPQGWQQLPARGAKMAAAGAFLGTLCALLMASVAARLSWHGALPWRWIGLASLVVALSGAVIAYRRHRHTRWRLDDQGFALIRGQLWQSQTHVPMSRVQHLDVRRGPLERAAHLSTLVVHTAGTRLNAVSVSGLDRRDAERLRDRLAHQLDHDDDAL